VRSGPASLRRRLFRLAATRSPRLALDSARRELRWRRAERALARAGRDGERVLVGPFLGEVGYELLYWTPLLRKLLRERGIERERVTVLTRGGAAVWYVDFAADAVEILDLVDVERYPEILRARRQHAGDAKQLTVDAFDLQLAARAREQIGDAHLLHPLLMYSRLRFLWEGLVSPDRAPSLADYARLAPPPVSLPLPERYVAVKAYFSDSLPETTKTRRLLDELVKQVAEWSEVIVLANSGRLDEHDEWHTTGTRVHSAIDWLEPRSNLAVQTEIVARADALVCTYGGFAYLGPLLGVPTLGVYARRAFNPVHLAVARAALPDARFDVVPVEAAATLLDRLLAA
jgi:hypothetical protein